MTRLLAILLATSALGFTRSPADLNHDGHVDGADQGLLLAAWGTAGGDLNADGTTNGADLGLLLSQWGPACTVVVAQPFGLSHPRLVPSWWGRYALRTGEPVFVLVPTRRSSGGINQRTVEWHETVRYLWHEGRYYLAEDQTPQSTDWTRTPYPGVETITQPDGTWSHDHGRTWNTPMEAR